MRLWIQRLMILMILMILPRTLTPLIPARQGDGAEQGRGQIAKAKTRRTTNDATNSLLFFWTPKQAKSNEGQK
jgi:hypothetical protein